MTIREEAMASEAFTQLRDVYEHREKALLAWKESGGKVVGELGSDVPDEILIAAGYLPIRVYADPDKPVKVADAYLEQTFEPVMRATFEKIVDGTYNKLVDFLAISHTSETEVRAWLYLREMRRIEPEMRIPPIAFLDWQLVRRRLCQEENKNVAARFREMVEKWIGRALDDEEIRDAMRICNEDRAALREIQALRRADKPRVNGSEALVIIGSALFMDRAEHARLVREVAQDAASWPEIEGPRIYVSGTHQETTELYDKIEACGAVVVGEDSDWGDRFFERDANTELLNPMLALVNCYTMRSSNYVKSLVTEHVAAFEKLVAEAGAQGVVFYSHEHDDYGSWDIPEMCKAVEARGVKCTELFRQKWPISNNDGLDAELAGFVSDLKEGSE